MDRSPATRASSSVAIARPDCKSPCDSWSKASRLPWKIAKSTRSKNSIRSRFFSTKWFPLPSLSQVIEAWSAQPSCVDYHASLASPSSRKSREELDLRDQPAVTAYFQKSKPAAVIFAAAKVGGIQANNNFPVEFLTDNLRAQLATMTSAFETGVKRFLFLGSTCIYPRLVSATNH